MQADPIGVSLINNSTLNLGGEFDVADFMSLTRDATTTTNLVSGSLFNTIAGLTLSNATGDLNIQGGIIRDGTLATSDGMQYIIENSFSNPDFQTSTGNSLTIDSTVTLIMNDGAFLDVTNGSGNGLVLNGTISMLSSGSFSEIQFNGGDGPIALGGTGTISFDSANDLHRLYPVSSGDVL